VSRLDKLQEEDLPPPSSEGKRTPGVKDKSAAVSHERDKDRELLEHLQVLEGLPPELQLNGLRDVRLAVQQGRIAELRAQRELERVFEQRRIMAVDEQLSMAGTKARRRQYQSLLLFGLLIPVAVLVAGLLYSNRLVDSPVLWAVAGTVFFMSYAAIVIFCRHVTWRLCRDDSAYTDTIPVSRADLGCSYNNNWYQLHVVVR
jgi:hypothetical protein